MARATIFLLSLCAALLALQPTAFAAKRVAFVVGIDAYDNLPAGEQLQKAVNDAGGTRGLARVEAPEGSFVMYSAGTGQAALDRLSDNDENSNSVFTRSLVPLIKTPGLPLQEVALKVREQVVALANSVGHKQTPAYYDQVIGRFCPAGCEGGAQEAVAPVPPPEPQVALAPSPPPVPQGPPAAICALKDAVYHTAKADADSLKKA